MVNDDKVYLYAYVCIMHGVSIYHIPLGILPKMSPYSVEQIQLDGRKIPYWTTVEVVVEFFSNRPLKREKFQFMSWIVFLSWLKTSTCESYHALFPSLEIIEHCSKTL